MITNATIPPPIAGSGCVLEEDEEAAEVSGDTTTVKIGIIHLIIKTQPQHNFDWA